MITNSDENLEKITGEALELYDKGKTIPEILNLYPDFRTELREMFETMQILVSEKESIIPPKDLLARIISHDQFKENVTNVGEGRYYYRDGTKGRSSVYNLKSIVNLFGMGKKFYIGLGIIALILVVGGIYQQSQNKQAISPIESELSFEEQSLDRDIADLGSFEQSRDLENFEQDMTEVIEENVVSKTPVKETGKTEISYVSVENMEQELALELGGFSNDFNDLASFEGDGSLNDFDGGLSGVAE